MTHAALRVVHALANGERPAYLAVAESRGERQTGQTFLGVMAGMSGRDGVRVADVVPGSAAAQAGLRDGDVIVRFAGLGVDRLDALRAVVGKRRPGDEVEVVYLRDGDERTVRVTLGARS